MGEREVRRLEDIPNVGPAISAKLRLVGVEHPSDLIGRNAYELFDRMEAEFGARLDPCLLDVLIAATRFMSGEPGMPWWSYTAERKATLKQRARADERR